jgi:hypothetical protein
MQIQYLKPMLKHLLCETRAKRALVFSQSLAEASSAFVTVEKNDQAIETEPSVLLNPHVSSVDLCLFGEELNSLKSNEVTNLLGMARNLLNAKLLLIKTPQLTKLSFNDLLGLGFKRLEKLDVDGEQIEVFAYDIDHYNRKREWNNARFWANPEYFEKSRW